LTRSLELGQDLAEPMKTPNTLTCLTVALAFATFTLSCLAQETEKEVIRIGMIGLDTSHATAFTAILNDPNHKDHVPGAKVVAGYKAFSSDIESSYTRVDKYVEELTTKRGVKMYDDMAEMCQAVDAVMVESVDGRPHLEQARAAIEAGKPVFVDKPMASSLKDAIAIFKLAEEKGVPCWSASNVRFHEGVVKAAESDFGDLVTTLSFGPASLEPHHPDLFWYGIHPTEALFTIMGPGCKTVSRTHTEGTDIVTGTWSEGRTGILMGIRAAKRSYGVKVFGTKAIVEESFGGAYPQLMTEVVKFFQTGKAPVSPSETVAILAFMEAADVSKERGGAPVQISEILKANGWVE